MEREIKKKLVILGNRMPLSPVVRNHAESLERMSWLAINMRLEGSPLNEGNIKEILDGNMILNASIEDHLMVSRLDELRRLMHRLNDMGTELKLTVAGEFFRVISEEEPVLRNRDIIELKFDHSIAMPWEIQDKMQQLQTYINQSHNKDSCFFTASVIHNYLLEICPFPRNNGIIARAAAVYYLMSKGLPLVFPEIKESDYNRRVSDAIKLKKPGNLQGDFMEAVYKQLELMIQLTAYTH